MSTSFATYRATAADVVEPMSWGVGTTTGTGGATVISSTDFKMAAGDDYAIDGGWAYWRDGALAGEERPILRAGLTSGTGDFSVGNPFSTTTPSGAAFEVHLRFPVTGRVPGAPWVNGYKQMTNDALKRLWFEDWISVAAVSNQVRYLLDVATYPWLGDRPKDRVLDVYGPRDQSSNVRRPAPFIWHVDDDAEAPELVFDSGGYSTGDTFYLKVARPCHTRIKISGVWTDLTPSSLNNGQYGLDADDDEAHAIESHVTALVVEAAMRALAMRQPALDMAVWTPEQRYWSEVGRQIKNRRLPRKNDGRLRLRAVGLGGGMMRGSRGWGGW